MKNAGKAIFLTFGISIILMMSYNPINPTQIFENTIICIYSIVILLFTFLSLFLKDILKYKITTKNKFTPKFEELKNTLLTLFIIVLLFGSYRLYYTNTLTITSSKWTAYLGFLFLIDAVVFLAWSSWIFSKAFNRFNGSRVKLELIKTGPYKIIRHPKYLGIIAWALATSLIFNNYISILLFVFITILIYMKILDEEKFLKNEFGEDWSTYKSNTYCLIPLIY